MTLTPETEDRFRGPRPEVPDRPETVEAVLGRVDIMFVIDATGSMASYIEEARRRTRAEVTRIAQQADLSVRVGIVAYRDHSDAQVIAAQTPLMTVEDAAFETTLASLEATGGGDAPEAVLDGIAAALQTSWRPQSDRFVFLIGDAPPHGTSGSGYDDHPTGCPCGRTAAATVSALTQSNIRLDAVSIAGMEPTTRAFTDLAAPTGGAVAVVSRPEEQTAAFAGSMTTTSDSVSRGRGLVTAMRAAPDGNAATWSNMTGMSMAATQSTLEYLNRRGLTAVEGTNVIIKNVTGTGIDSSKNIVVDDTEPTV